MFLALGFFVEKLVRVRVGAVALGQLAPGELRPLSKSEVAQLKQSVGLGGNLVGNRRHARGGSKKPLVGHSPQQH